VSEELMLMAEVSSATRVPIATLRFWRATQPEKGPKSFRLGGRVVYKTSDVEAWVAAQYGRVA
jgi:predicted DNA-binding transcriptional regulator AlpA